MLEISPGGIEKAGLRLPLDPDLRGMSEAQSIRRCKGMKVRAQVMAGGLDECPSFDSELTAGELAGGGGMEGAETLGKPLGESPRRNMHATWLETAKDDQGFSRALRIQHPRTC